jgi:PrtD family type I secretion system ABC transporter
MRKYMMRLVPELGCGFFFSLFINLLALGYILYLRLLFDKVMTSRSLETLFFLTAAVIGAYIISGILETIRSKLLVRVGVKFDRTVAERLFQRMITGSAEPGASKNTRGLRDLNRIRNFLGGTGIFALFDTPWVPVYLAVIFLFHPVLGYVACAGALLLMLLVVAQEFTTSRLQERHSRSSLDTDQFQSFAMRNAQAVYAMGMLPALAGRWRGFNRQDVAFEDAMAGRTGMFQSLAKVIMMGTVIIIMAVGAYLVILHEATLGTMVAASMFMGRGLAPIMMLGNAWKSWLEARSSYKNLDRLMAEHEDIRADQSTEAEAKLTELPSTFRVEDVSYSFGGLPVLSNISFTVQPGEILAIIGPSGAGKSTLAKIMLGLWKPAEGSVFLGDIPLPSVDRALLGQKTGYVPQEIDLFAGTVAENIARMGEVDSEAVVEAANEVGAHGMILQLPRGYDTPIGPGGINLSGGQQQAIALARARYGAPWFMLLDEPDSHLDHQSRTELNTLLLKLKERPIFQIIISHKRELAGLADRVLLLDRGRAVEMNAAEYRKIQQE